MRSSTGSAGTSRPTGFKAPATESSVGAHAHASIPAALRLIGFGARRSWSPKRTARTDASRVGLACLDQCAGPTIVCAQAGNVNTGASIPRSTRAVTRARGAWLHVNGAFGLWAAAVPELRELVLGLEAADSWRPTDTSGSTCRTIPGCVCRPSGSASSGHEHGAWYLPRGIG